MKLRSSALAVALAAAFFSLPGGAGAQQSAGAPTLYKQLGGYDGIAAVTDDLIGRLAADPKLAKFFVGLNDQRKAELRQHFVEFICAKAGGPCLYTGRDMKVAHKGLNITEDEWNAGEADFTATLNKFNVPQDIRSQLGQLLAQIKPDIVTGM